MHLKDTAPCDTTVQDALDKTSGTNRAPKIADRHLALDFESIALLRSAGVVLKPTSVSLKSPQISPDKIPVDELGLSMPQLIL